ncbi:MAG: nitric-oxide reductase large subunit, partial [Desulfovibrio sp.]|nr:nitric-oxide reductase large subunit [Desulfovibrio sp.]
MSEPDYLGKTLQECGEGDHVSRWWITIFGFVLIYGFAVLLTITGKAYVDKPPIPKTVADPAGKVLFTREMVKEGQALFLAKGLMSNGTVWGHGSYLGPDFPALTLHKMGEITADFLSISAFGKPFEELSENQKEGIEAQVPAAMKVNRYNAKNETLVFSPAETAVFDMSPAYWKEYLSRPENNGGLRANLISDPEELKKLSAYFCWMAWASVAPRPGETYSYTNNFPYDPLVGNTPITISYIWSAASLIFLLGGVGFILYLMGRNQDWGWHPENCVLRPLIAPHMVSASQAALIKFVVVVSLL